MLEYAWDSQATQTVSNTSFLSEPLLQKQKALQDALGLETGLTACQNNF